MSDNPQARRQPRYFDAEQPLEQLAESEQQELLHEPPLQTDQPKSARLWRWLSAGFVLLLLAAAVETVLFIQSSWQQHAWLGTLWTIAIGLLLLAVLALSLREWWRMVKLKRRWRRQQAMQDAQQPFSAESLLAELQRDDLTQLWQQQDSDHWHPAELRQRFELDILQKVDSAAEREVSRWSMEAAILVAASPSAILDMLLVLWRNQRMINRIAGLYGVELGYWSRIRLWRKIFTNIAYAGFSEIVTDVGGSMLGAELAGKLSLRAGQGLGAGLLTARLGYHCMALCRPMPFQHVKRPRLAGIYKPLLRQLGEKLPRLFRAADTVKSGQR
ncbi:YcjF family protein [Idiomarina xiamenensis]|uniref:TIGR01620 family protein n=1 Tax=Idiomarina xiamenensis 10-D-4 TaxID=740709 RepID=K2JML6_9GAMM|nr:TIGR01620 family protein [Idiomarina xiamenensis]EKE84761.1 hypothetical protein A10D4_04085 [Idiomarina xiamenensis 10-D-4]